MINEIHFGDCRDSLRAMAAAGVKVQTCVTSPPYFGLRDYGHAGQIGLEETPEQFIAELVDVFRCVRDVLADDGTLWVNIGDSYFSTTKGSGGAGKSTLGPNKDLQNIQFQKMDPIKINAGDTGCKPKDLIGIPWMLAFALRADGWYLRQDIIWAKPNPMPESVTDRCTKAHEYVFLLSKGPRYFYDAEAVKEGAVSAGRIPGGNRKVDAFRNDAGRDMTIPVAETRNRRSVWTIATRPYKGAHFAVFPSALVEPCILAGTSERGHCPVCKARWVRQVEKTTSFESGSGRAGTTAEEANASGKHIGGIQGGNKNLKLGPCVTATTTGGAPACACGVEPTPDIVLDPFMGSGTTAAVAIEHGRQFIGCELNDTYKPLQDERIDNAYAGGIL